MIRCPDWDGWWCPVCPKFCPFAQQGGCPVPSTCPAMRMHHCSGPTSWDGGSKKDPRDHVTRMTVGTTTAKGRRFRADLFSLVWTWRLTGKVLDFERVLKVSERNWKLIAWQESDQYFDNCCSLDIDYVSRTIWYISSKNVGVSWRLDWSPQNFGRGGVIEYLMVSSLYR